MMHGLNLHFPNLKIIGEETEEYKGRIEYNYSQLDLDMLPSSSKIDRNLKNDEVCLWIDPLDCTLGYVNGNVEDVTVLIGISSF